MENAKAPESPQTMSQGEAHEATAVGPPERDSPAPPCEAAGRPAPAGRMVHTAPAEHSVATAIRATPEEIAHEAIRYRRLQRAVDVALAFIHQSNDLTLGDTIEIVLHARSIALELFPGSEQKFDLLYRPRLLRAINERFGIEVAAD